MYNSVRGVNREQEASNDDVLFNQTFFSSFK